MTAKAEAQQNLQAAYDLLDTHIREFNRMSAEDQATIEAAKAALLEAGAEAVEPEEPEEA